MKKYLPTKGFTTSMKTGRGFTLIELMVVVTIIAILSVVGISLYTTAQKNARDGIRRAEISSLGKSIETSRDPTATTTTYVYTGGSPGDNYENDYPQNKARDPLRDSSKQQYCMATHATVAVLDPASWATVDDNCPTSQVGAPAYSEAIGGDGNWATAALDTGARYWKLCARLEVSGNFFCVQNSQ